MPLQFKQSESINNCFLDRSCCKINMFKFFIFAAILAGFLGFALGCKNDSSNLNAIDEAMQPGIEVVKGVDMIYSEGGSTKARLQAPKLLRHKTENPYLEFPEGLKVTFYDDSLKSTGQLTAKYGTRNINDRKTMVRDSVVWKSLSEKNKLESEDLHWDENKRKLYSDKVVRVTTETEYITGKGFEANQDFSSYSIKQVTGTIAVNANQFE